MHMQPAQTDFRSGFRPAHIHPDGDTCPTCEQAIPLDKLEEISGRIALRQHEHEQSIRIALEERFKSERAQASAEAATALEEERRRAAADLAAAGVRVLLFDWEGSYPWAAAEHTKGANGLVTRVFNWEQAEREIMKLVAQHQGAEE